ncbi:MAG: hypothetical protein PVJ92_02585 [Candidatus Dependentiae bacterium]
MIFNKLSPRALRCAFLISLACAGVAAPMESGDSGSATQLPDSDLQEIFDSTLDRQGLGHTKYTFGLDKEVSFIHSVDDGNKTHYQGTVRYLLINIKKEILFGFIAHLDKKYNKRFVKDCTRHGLNPYVSDNSLTLKTRLLDEEGNKTPSLWDRYYNGQSTFAIESLVQKARKSGYQGVLTPVELFLSECGAESLGYRADMPLQIGDLNGSLRDFVNEEDKHEMLKAYLVKHKQLKAALEETGLRAFMNEKDLNPESNISLGDNVVTLRHYLADNEATVAGAIVRLYAYAKENGYAGRSPFRWLLQHGYERDLTQDAADAGYESQDEEYFGSSKKTFRQAIADGQDGAVLQRVAQQRRFARRLQAEGLTDFAREHGITVKMPMSFTETERVGGGRERHTTTEGSIAGFMLVDRSDEVIAKLKSDRRWQRLKPFVIAGGAALTAAVIYSIVKNKYNTAMAERDALLKKSQYEWLWEAIFAIGRTQVHKSRTLLTQDEVAAALQPLGANDALVELFYDLQKAHHEGYPEGRDHTLGSIFVLKTYLRTGEINTYTLDIKEEVPAEQATRIKDILESIKTEWWDDHALGNEKESFRNWLFSKKKTYQSFWRTPAQA